MITPNESGLQGRSSFGLNALAMLLLIASVLFLYHPVSREKPTPPATTHTSKAVQKMDSEPLTRVTVLPDPMPEKPASNPKADSGKAMSEAHTPAVNASFDMPILDYIEALQQKTGAKLVLFDATQRRIVGTVEKGKLIRGNIDTDGMSMRARNITRDLPDSFRKRLIKQSEVNSATRFLIILPTDAEKRFEQGLERALAPSGIAWQVIDQIDICYRQNGTNIVADIQRIKTDGKTTRIGISTPIW